MTTLAIWSPAGPSTSPGSFSAKSHWLNEVTLLICVSHHPHCCAFAAEPRSRPAGRKLQPSPAANGSPGRAAARGQGSPCQAQPWLVMNGEHMQQVWPQLNSPSPLDGSLQMQHHAFHDTQGQGAWLSTPSNRLSISSPLFMGNLVCPRFMLQRTKYPPA